jgi:hypothetical protein
MGPWQNAEKSSNGAANHEPERKRRQRPGVGPRENVKKVC